MERETLLAQLAKEEYCYLTTTGRISGRPHEIEIWFGVQKDTLYLLSGNPRSDWVLNLLKNPSVTVRVGKHIFTGTARLVEEKEEEKTARYLVAGKYRELESDQTLSHWAQTALPVAIDVQTQATG